MLFMVENWTMYMHPYERDMSAKVSESSAMERMAGLQAISWFVNIDRVADSNSAETRLSVFHSRRRESMNDSHEFLNLISC